MKNSILHMFWGFIIVLIDTRIETFDVLLDPVGYLFIYIGLIQVSNISQRAKTGLTVAFILIIMSIPAIVMDPNTIIFGFWKFYFLAVNILDVVLVYYIFLVLIELVESHKEFELKIRTEKIMKAYLAIILTVIFLNTFSLNFSLFIWLFALLGIVGLITHIVFLVLLFKFRNLGDQLEKNTMEG
ncbi:hypothetical protein ACTWQB_04250 [Piscibacillus sp. B03]|uniref:hypothetical protein n=1 Tax=Piscibacillus sp. B03 TaxID=3457430 RepID=UPI003FCD2FA2